MKKIGTVVVIAISFMVNVSNISANETGIWKTVDGNNGFNQNKIYVYEIENKGYAKGWNEIDNKWYYFDQTTGYLIQNNWIDNYYLGADGAMLKDEWIVDKIGTTPNLIAYFVGSDGSWNRDAIYTGCEGTWKEDETGWRFEREDGTYPVREFEYIQSKWYLFDSNGYMVTGLSSNEETGGLYYFYSDGRLASNAGWISISDGKWIFINGDQCMMDAVTSDGYYIDQTGIWEE